MKQRAQRGMGMIDALIALAILAFGLLALTRFQGRMTSQSTDAMARQNANRLADELVSMAVLDPCWLGLLYGASNRNLHQCRGACFDDQLGDSGVNGCAGIFGSDCHGFG